MTIFQNIRQILFQPFFAPSFYLFILLIKMAMNMQFSMHNVSCSVLDQFIFLSPFCTTIFLFSIYAYIHIYCVVIYTFIYSDFVNGFQTPSVGYIISISPQIYLKCLQFIWFHSFSGIWRGFYLFTRSVHNMYFSW